MKSILIALLASSTEAINLTQPPRSYNQYEVFPEAYTPSAQEKLAQYEADEEKEDRRTWGEDDEELEDNDYVQIKRSQFIDLEDDHTMCQEGAEEY